MFFETEESLVAADTDGSFDVYERTGTTTTLVSTGSTGGNGAFDVFFDDVSTDGLRVFFETEEQLVAGDTDTQTDIYERSAGTTSLVSAGTPGNGNFAAIFAGISQDGSRVFFETDEALIPADGDSLLRRVPAPGRDDHPACRPARPAATARSTRPSADPR